MDVNAEDVDEKLVFAAFQKQLQAEQQTQSLDDLPSLPGPEVNGRRTTVVSLSPSQLAQSSLEKSLYEVINLSFVTQNIHKGGPRLVHPGELSVELSVVPGSVTYVLYYSGTNQVVGTASARRFFGKIHVGDNADEHQRKNGNMWHRFGPVPADAAAWEMCTMAVDIHLQKQGIASYLMNLVEDGIKTSFKTVRQEAQERGEVPPSRLLIMITTTKERNFPFYSHRGFVKDYETLYRPGTWGSESGFTIIQMSKDVEIDDIIH